MRIDKLGFKISFPIDFFVELNEFAKRKSFNSCGQPDSTYTKNFIRNFCEAWGATYAHGVTKGVFVFENLGFVLKFNIVDNRANCTQEYEAYLRAKYYKVDRICMPIDVFYTAPCGERFFIQPFAQVMEENEDIYFAIEDLFRERKFCERKIERFSESFSYCENVPLSFWKRCVQYYGWKFMRRVRQWADNCCVEDLHEGNIGVVGNLRPVLVDYSGAYYL